MARPAASKSAQSSPRLPLHGLAGEGAVAETDETHEAAERVSEDVAEALGIGQRPLHGREKGIAGAEADDHFSGGGGAHADEAAGVVSGADDHLAIVVQAVAAGEIRGDRTGDGAGVLEGRKFLGKAGGGGVQEIGIPVVVGQVHEVHPGAVAAVDADAFSGEERSDERADEMDFLGAGVKGGVVFGKFPDLGAGEAFGGDRAAAGANFAGSAEGGGDFQAFVRGRNVHPDRRGLPGEAGGQLLGEQFPGVQVSDGFGELVVEINAAVLLAGDGKGGNLIKGRFGFGETPEEEIEAPRPTSGARRGPRRFSPRSSSRWGNGNEGGPFQNSPSARGRRCRTRCRE